MLYVSQTEVFLLVWEELGRRRSCISDQDCKLYHLQVITDEEELHKMSMECEPPLGGLPPPPPLSTVAFYPNLEDRPNYQPIWSISYPTQTRKRNPSPTPSAASSASSTPSHYSTGEKPSQFADEKHRLPQSLLAAAPNKFGERQDDEVRDDNRDFILAHSSRVHCSQRCCESTGGEEAPLIE